MLESWSARSVSRIATFRRDSHLPAEYYGFVLSNQKERLMIGYIIGAVVVAFIGVLAYAGLSGKVKMNDGCCAPNDPSKDLRMRDS